MKDNEGILARYQFIEGQLQSVPTSLASIKEMLDGKVIVNEAEWLIVRGIIFQPTVSRGLLPGVLDKYPEIVPLILGIKSISPGFDMCLRSPTLDQTTKPPKGDEEPTILYTEGDKVAIATLYNAMWGQSFAINDPETAMKQTIELYNKTIKNI